MDISSYFVTVSMRQEFPSLPSQELLTAIQELAGAGKIKTFDIQIKSVREQVGVSSVNTIIEIETSNTDNEVAEKLNPLLPKRKHHTFA